MSDIKTFVSKFPKEFNEFVNVFKSFKINNNTQEISRETAVNLIENPYLKEFLKALTEDELIELLRMLGLKLKKKVNVKTNNKKTKISILNSIVQKMLFSGLEEEYKKQTFDLLAKMPTDKLERLDKFEKFEKSFIDEIVMSVLKVEENIINEFDMTNDKNNNKNMKETDIVSQIKNRFSFGNETGNVTDLKHIHNNDKQNSLG